MTADAIVAISAAVVALTQLVKWSGLPDKMGPLAVLLFSLGGVLFWGWSYEALSRHAAFEFFGAWISVATSAAGIFGFTRAGSEAVTRTSAPPKGAAGGSATTG